MRLKVVATLVLFLTLPALAQKVDLRGPAPEAGETLVTTITSSTEPGDLSMTVQGQALQGQMETDSVNVIEQTILAVEDGEPTQVQVKFVKAQTVTHTTMFGQTQKQEDTNMQGVVMIQTKAGDTWETEVEGNQLPQEAKDLIKNAGYVDQRQVFPDRPVGVGDAWEIEDGLLQAFMGQTGIPGATFEGEMRFEMVELKEEDDQLIAVLNFEMDGTIKMDLSPDPTTTMSIVVQMEGGGTILRNLTDYTTHQEFAGDMEMTMEVMAGGQQAMKMDAEMPMKVKQTQERK